MKNFKISSENASGSLQGYINTSYDKLAKLFGKPNSKGDDYKVSTEWCVEDENGNTAYIYDYKMTKKYSSNYPSVKKFRQLSEYDWHIGSDNNETAKDLIEFIKENIK